MSLIRSDIPLSSWAVDISIFNSQFETIPSRELTNLTWSEFADTVAPIHGALVTPCKKSSKYFIASSLLNTKLVGKTLQVNLMQGGDGYGKQRSKHHVTHSSAVVFDIDDLDIDYISSVKTLLGELGISYLVYTTYNHMRDQEVRLRIVLPHDRNVGVHEYALLHNWLNLNLFNGQADRTGSSLYQCQGIWACPIERQHLSKRKSFEAGLLHIPDSILSQRKPVPKMANSVNVQMLPGLDLLHLVYGCIANDKVLRRLRFNKKVRDGAGREFTVLQLAGALRSRGFSDSKIFDICQTWSSRYCSPALNVSVIEDRCSRYSSNNTVLSDVAHLFARDLAYELLCERIKESDGRIASSDSLLCANYLKKWHPEHFLSLGFPKNMEVA